MLIALILSFFFLMLEIRGAVYFKEHIAFIVKSKTTKLEKFKEIAKFL
jgi:hypothetical protein